MAPFNLVQVGLDQSSVVYLLFVLVKYGKKKKRKREKYVRNKGDKKLESVFGAFSV